MLNILINAYEVEQLLNLYIYISGDICNCADGGSRRGHPENCKAYVICNEANGVMYPFGVNCQPELYRNSITGICADNYSTAICTEDVPHGRYCISCRLPEQNHFVQICVIYISVYE